MDNCIKIEYRKEKFRYNKCKWEFKVLVKQCIIVIHTTELVQALLKTKKREVLQKEKLVTAQKFLRSSIIYRTS